VHHLILALQRGNQGCADEAAGAYDGEGLTIDGHRDAPNSSVCIGFNPHG
jgi:hypothetical protein